MLLKALTLISFIAATQAENPIVTNPQNMTYTAGDVMDIKWAGGDSGFVNIDLVGPSLDYPMNIAAGVPAEVGQYAWEIPSVLKTAAGYNLRVWGNSPDDASGKSQVFTVMNDIPFAANSFVVLSPNDKQKCYAGKDCKIQWNFNDQNNYPAHVDIGLYREGEVTPLVHIATVPSGDREYTWSVPEDYALTEGNVFIAVSGDGLLANGPNQSTDFAATSAAFDWKESPEVAEENEEEADLEKKDDKKDDDRNRFKAKDNHDDDDESAASLTTGSIFQIAAIAILVPLALVF